MVNDQDVLKVGLEKIYNKNYMLQQDGAICHTAVSTKEFLKANKIRTLERWTAQSPDLNIIEQMWAYLKKTVKAKNYCN